MNKVSTTKLSKQAGIDSKSFFALLQDHGLITKNNDDWTLTSEGESLGGEYKNSTRFGQYIVWPETLDIPEAKTAPTTPVPEQMLTSTALGKNFEMSANKINSILSEIGWIKKGIKGWLLTPQGEKQGGQQSKDRKSGIPYTRWPESIINSKILKETILSFKGDQLTHNHNEKQNSLTHNSAEFREKFEAKHRATDGHFVRSKAEMLIDNWLYMAEIVHAYERKLPIEENVYCDFYIPTGKVYIEYWGYENDSKYLSRKKEKQNIYKKYGFNLIELEDKDVQNLDDNLPRMLLEFGVQSY